MCAYYICSCVYSKYTDVYMSTFMSLHPPSYNVARVHFLAMCAMIHDDLIQQVFILATSLFMIFHYVYEECYVSYCVGAISATIMC